MITILKKIHYKLMLLKYLKEIKLIEKGKLKALRGKEIYKFLKRLSKEAV